MCGYALDDDDWAELDKWDAEKEFIREIMSDNVNAVAERIKTNYPGINFDQGKPFKNAVLKGNPIIVAIFLRSDKLDASDENFCAQVFAHASHHIEIFKMIALDYRFSTRYYMCIPCGTTSNILVASRELRLIGLTHTNNLRRQYKTDSVMAIQVFCIIIALEDKYVDFMAVELEKLPGYTKEPIVQCQDCIKITHGIANVLRKQNVQAASGFNTSLSCRTILCKINTFFDEIKKNSLFHYFNNNK